MLSFYTFENVEFLVKKLNENGHPKLKYIISYLFTYLFLKGYPKK